MTGVPAGPSLAERNKMKTKTEAVIVSQKQIQDGICDLVLSVPVIAEQAVPGQFVNVFLNDPSKLLPRPISLCGTDAEEGTIRLAYRVSGEGTGTEELSRMREGERVSVMGPLGNGFPLEEAAGRHVCLIGGGIGIPPMLETARVLHSSVGVSGRKGDGEYLTAPTEITSVLGFRDRTFLVPEFEAYGKVLIATEDGSTGTKGNVLDAIRGDGTEPGVIFACGPLPMLRALKAFAAAHHIPCWISMEERMACGIGACLACVCRTTETDPHSHVKNARVCADGPVFEAGKLDL